LAIKKSGAGLRFLGDELRRFIGAVEADQVSSISLGETGYPPVDLYETEDELVIEADLPGVEVGDIEVSVECGMVTIEGVKRERLDEAEKVNYLCMERSFETFRRMLKITTPINPRKGSASYSQGVLRVVFPKVKDKRGLVVKVKIVKE